jgi:hypothetical protein
MIRVMNFRVPLKSENFMDSLAIISLSRTTLLHAVNCVTSNSKDMGSDEVM